MHKLPLLAVASAAMLLAGHALAAPGDALYAGPGQQIRVGDGAVLNLYCMGKGSPAVVFDSGWEDWSPDWAIVQPEVAKYTRACAYDRAGDGFSGPGPMPRTGLRMAGELRDALHKAGVRGPYILVGNSFGGDVVRIFAQRYTGEVAALVLPDADIGDGEPVAVRDDEHRGEADLIKDVRACRDAVASGGPLPPLPAEAHKPLRTCAQQFFRGLPEVAWSDELNAEILKLADSKTAMYDTAISEMQEMPSNEAYLRSHPLRLGRRPLVILTSGHHAIGDPGGGGPLPAQMQAYEAMVKGIYDRWLSWSADAREVAADHSSENIELDRPDAIAAAIHAVYAKARS